MGAHSLSGVEMASFFPGCSVQLGCYGAALLLHHTHTHRKEWVVTNNNINHENVFKPRKKAFVVCDS